MEQVLQKVQRLDYSPLRISESIETREIREALEATLHVQDGILKPKIIETHLDYLKSKFSIPDYKIKVFIAYLYGEPCGYVVSDLNPEYKSYGRKCGTFGWLNVYNFEICKKLLKQCELFVKENRLRKIRGPINFPKNQAGFGLQTEGYSEQMLYGVANQNSNLKLYNYLQRLHYESESEYSCVKVDVESWEKGNTLDKKLKLCCLTKDEINEKFDEIINLTRDSFSTILPDTSGGGSKNVKNLLELATDVPKTHFRYQECPDLYKKYKNIPEFTEAWKKADLKNMVTMFPMVLERKTNKLVGMLIGVLDYYQYWRNEYVSRVNVHTAMVRRGYNGKGVFSSLNNFGQATNRALRGLTYYEGTAIWTRNSKGVNNEDAINSIFPHCSPIRKHLVFEKRIR
ncbi:MAG: hypothetical protein ACXABO_19410 [Promethearchaeota archaeon]|jgi:hypothetical protein